jgi:hypothetical protein
MKQKLVLFVLLFAGGALGQTYTPMFGFHTNHIYSFPIRVPYSCWRSLNSTEDEGGSSWMAIQKGPDIYNYSLIDTAMEDLAAQSKTCAVYTPYLTPAFIASHTGYTLSGKGTRHCGCSYSWMGNRYNCYPPADLNADGSGTDQTWKDFIRNLAEHVHSKHLANPGKYADIDYWEGGNEFIDNGPQWCGSYAQLARMLQDEKCVIEGRGKGCTAPAINPNARVMTVAMFAPDGVDKPYLSTVPNIADGESPAQVADMINTHNNYVLASEPEQIISNINAMRKVVDANPDSAGKPIFGTEGGWQHYKETGFTWGQTPSWMERFVIAISSTGIAAHIFYAYDSYDTNKATGPVNTDLWTVANSSNNNYYCGRSMPANEGYFCQPTPAYVASYAWVQKVIWPRPCSGSNGIWTCPHTSYGGKYKTGEFVWYSVEGHTVSFKVPAGFSKVEDIAGKITSVGEGEKITISDNPVLLMSEN